VPMIDVYATEGTFADPHQLAADPGPDANDHRRCPRHPQVPQEHGRAYPRDGRSAISNVDGHSGYVRVQVLTNAGALDRDKQLAVVSQFRQLVTTAAADPSLSERTWVLLTEAIDGGWGLGDHANTNDELIAAARAQMAELAAARSNDD
jgi:hypothetical protein